MELAAPAERARGEGAVPGVDAELACRMRERSEADADMGGDGMVKCSGLFGVVWSVAEDVGEEGEGG